MLIFVNALFFSHEVKLFLLLLLLSNCNHQVGYFVAMMPAGYVCVSVIHQTLDMGYRICSMRM